MSLILQHQASFTPVRQIPNHTDPTEYYVRAVIRYAYTDELITNLDLDLKGSQRYSKNWEVPADPSGQGYYISIITSVYTDSAHTTKSENYGDEANEYLVQERVLGSLKSGGGLDMRTTRRIIEESLEKIKFPEQEKISIPKQKEYDDKFNELTRGLSDIKTLIASIPTENVNLSPLMTRLNELSQEVKTKPVTKETDLKPMSEIISKIRKELFDVEKKIEKVSKDTGELIGDKHITLNIQPIQTEIKSQQEKKPFNINKLAK